MRGVAALTVLAHHAYKHTSEPALTGAAVGLVEFARHGLTLFFALSGLLLFVPYVMAILGGRAWPPLRRYASSRFLRIYPAYLTIFILVAFVFGAAYLDGAPATAEHGPVGRMNDPVDIAMNVVLVQTYVPGSVLTGIGPAWSLTAEVAFYVLLPALAYGGYSLARRWTPLAGAVTPAVVLIAVGLVTKAYVGLHTRSLTAAERAEWSWVAGLD